jgi:predicted Zn-dependent protease
MLGLAEIKRFVTAAIALLSRESDLAAFEIYCSSGEQIVARLNYTGEIASRGVEEVKSLAADGFALRIVTRRDPHELGSASMAGDLSMDGVKRALHQALSATVVDPHFPGLPGEFMAAKARGGNGGLIGASHLSMVRAGWDTLEGALREFKRRLPPDLSNPGLIIGGDFTLTRERIALGSSAMGGVRADQDAWFTASITAIIEAISAKATASAVGRTEEDLQRAQAKLGKDAISRALDSRPPVCPPSGKYKVLLGPQPLAEILSYMVIPSLTTGAFYRADSAYQSRFGSKVMDARINLIDEPVGKGAIQRSITCEGLPASRTVLIRNGRLEGLLSNYYDSHRLMVDEKRSHKLGASAPPKINFAAANGYRLGDDGGRCFDSAPHSSASSVFMRAKEGVSQAELIKSVRNGILIGRVWYTYPINGQRAGDFTCTVSGDSYLIENGRIAAPIAPNCLRINAHIDDVFGSIIAAGNRTLPSFVWGQPEIFYVPALVVDQLSLASLASPF